MRPNRRPPAVLAYCNVSVFSGGAYLLQRRLSLSTICFRVRRSRCLFLDGKRRDCAVPTELGGFGSRPACRGCAAAASLASSPASSLAQSQLSIKGVQQRSQYPGEVSLRQALRTGRAVSVAVAAGQLPRPDGRPDASCNGERECANGRTSLRTHPGRTWLLLSVHLTAPERAPGLLQSLVVSS